MKIYIVTDNEGLAGVSGANYISPDRGRNDLVAHARQLLADEINACIEGCCRAGATEIVVRDGHGDGQNVTRAMIDPRADLICGATPGVLLADLEGSDGLILLGYHAKAGTPGAVCEHTMSSLTWQNLWINGRKTGEIGICAYIAGEHKVPVIMVSGDDKTCAEAAEWLPHAVTCQVKKGFSCHGARISAPEKTLSLITACAEKAVRQAQECPLLLAETPVKFRLEMVSRNMPPFHEGDLLPDARTREVTSSSVEKAFFS